MPIGFRERFRNDWRGLSHRRNRFCDNGAEKNQEKLGRDGDGGIGRWQIQQQESIRVAADRPAPVEGLRTTIEARHWLWNPSFVIPYNVRSANGAIVLKAGAQFNPLDKVSLKNNLIFFSGDDPAQLSWVQEQNKALKGRVLLILVNGSLGEVQAHFPQNMFFLIKVVG